MTRAQQDLYWREWHLCKNALQKLRAGEDLDELRKQLHIRAIGTAKSSLALTNPDLDKVLAVFRSYSRPGDLQAQLDAIDGPRKRILHNPTIRRCLTLIGVVERHRESYLEAIASRLTHKGLDDLDNKDLSKVIAALNYQAKREEARR